jgi:hypothetical protein
MNLLEAVNRSFEIGNLVRTNTKLHIDGPLGLKGLIWQGYHLTRGIVNDVLLGLL